MFVIKNNIHDAQRN